MLLVLFRAPISRPGAACSRICQPPASEAAAELLAGIERFCTGVGCRHRAIVNYFGQQLACEDCGACDVCLEESTTSAMRS